MEATLLPEARSAAVKVVALVTKRPDISRDVFVDRWTDAHVRLSSQLGMSPYTINITVRAVDGEDPAVDGTAEMVWASLELFEAAMASEVGRRAEADVRRFASHIQLLIVEEWTVPAGTRIAVPTRR